MFCLIVMSFHRMIHWLILLLLLAADLLTKYIFFDKRYLADWFFIEPVLNRWISFSLAFPLDIVIILSLVALVVFVWMYYTKSLYMEAFILLVAGTIGNMYDRIVYDGVRDFLVLPEWFIFNLADVWLTLGMLGLLLYQWYEKKWRLP